MSVPPFFGPEIHVNTATSLAQFRPSVTALANGKFVAVWEDGSHAAGDADITAVRGQLYNADGTPAGGEFLINQATAGTQGVPAVTALPDGRFVVAWHDTSHIGGDAEAFGIKARIFNPDGAAAGNEFLVNTNTALSQFDPAIATLKDGGFVITWTREIAAGDNDARGRAFDASGTALGPDFDVDSTHGIGALEHQTAVAGLANGNYVVAWTDGGVIESDGSGSHVRAQIFSGNGTFLGGEFIVNGLAKNDQFDPAITVLANGNFVVTWSSDFSGGDIDVLGRVFTQDGRPVGNGFVVNAGPKSEISSSVIALADGAFMVTWENGVRDDQTDGSGTHVGGRLFNADGDATSEAFIVNTTAGGNQGDPALTTLSDGRVVAVWTDFGGNGDDPSAGIRAQIIDPRTKAVSLNGSALGDDWVGTGFADTMNGNGGNDRIAGEAGDDAIDGGAGADVMIGGSGNDTYRVDDTGDKVVETAGGGTDTVVSSVAVSLDVEVENLTLVGGPDGIAKGSTSGLNGTGNALANVITGSAGANLIDGGAGNDHLRGEAGLDRISGGLGDDTMAGGLGKDKLIGGDGKDSFVFDADLGKVNADKIARFKAKDDTILLDGDSFDGLGLGLLRKKAYFEGDAAHDGSDRVILTGKGNLLFDADGKGGEKAVLFAKVGKDADLSHADFIVI